MDTTAGISFLCEKLFLERDGFLYAFIQRADENDRAAAWQFLFAAF
jgi:hypothetical protein